MYWHLQTILNVTVCTISCLPVKKADAAIAYVETTSAARRILFRIIALLRMWASSINAFDRCCTPELRQSCKVMGPTGRLSPALVVFLERIRAAGGVAFMARGCRDVRRKFKPWRAKHDTRNNESQ